MIYSSLSPDRFNRFFFAAQYIKMICETIPPHPRILDLGSNENLLSPSIDQRPVFELDVIRSRQNGLFVQSLVQATPFPDQSMDIVVCLDVFEHNPEAVRPELMREIARITRHTALIAFPVKTTFNVQHEKKLADIHHILHGESNSFLMEHQTCGLVDSDDILVEAGQSFQFTKRIPVFSKYLWLISHLTDYFLGMLPETQPIRDCINACINRIPQMASDAADGYRTFIIASHHPIPQLPTEPSRWMPETSISDNLVEAFRKTYLSLSNLHEYSKKLEHSIHSLEKTYHEIENQLKLTEHSLADKQEYASRLEKMVTDHQAEIDSLNQQNCRITDRVRQLDDQQSHLDSLVTAFNQLEAHALQLENNIHQKDRTITDLQQKLTRMLVDFTIRNQSP